MSGVDLSKLPPPAVVSELDYEVLRGAWLGRVAVKVPGFDAGGLESEPVVILCEVGAGRELLQLQHVNDSAEACMLARATGSDLDNLAANLGVARRAGESDLSLRLRAASAQQGISTAGPEAAYRRHALAASPDAEDAAIASPDDSPGTVIVTVVARHLDAEPSLELGSVPPAAGEILRALARAGSAPELYYDGTGGRVAAGSLALTNELTLERIRYVAASGSKSLGILAAENGLPAWAAGAGAAKSLYLFDPQGGVEFPFADSALLPAPQGEADRPTGWSMADGDARAAWLDGIDENEGFAVLACDAGALDESLSPRVLAMLADIRTALSDEEVRPMGDRVTVSAATDASYDVTATLHILAGARDAVLAAARESLKAWALSARRVGRMVPRSGIIAALSVEGVFRVEVSDPAADIAAVDGGVHTLGTIDLTGAAAA